MKKMMMFDIVRSVNRFEHPTSMGWRDIILNFVVDSTSVFELQLVHDKMTHVDKRDTEVFEQIRFFEELMGEDS